MAKQGWISVHRELQEHWVWNDKPFSRGQAWIDLLLLANHKDNKFLFGNKLVEVKTGSFITSIRKLAERWGWSRHKVQDFLTLLESDKMLTAKRDTKKTAITIENYSFYQSPDNTKEPQKSHKRATKGTVKDTNNNENNENNENKVNKLTYSSIPELNDVLIAFVDFRKKIKKPMTEQAVKLLITKLNKMTDSIDEQIEILNQSIMNGWQSVYPLKDKPKAKPQSEYDNFMAQLAAMRED